MQKISFDIAQWNRLFPYFFILNEDMELVAVGDALSKLIPNGLNNKYSSFFEIQHPTIEIIDFNS